MFERGAPVESNFLVPGKQKLQIYKGEREQTLMEKLEILSDAAKYDVSCSSSGVERRGDGTGIGNASKAGICHSFSSDGRCISLLKVLFSNECSYDCKYCINRRSNDVPRASFTPDEICELTIQFYRINYIEGLFLSSGIIKSPTYTMELIYEAVYKLRTKYRFQGYIHVKAIPGADPELIARMGLLADRMSVNLELPTAEGLSRLAPNKHRKNILLPMRQIQQGISQNKNELTLYRNAPSFVPAGQSTQMIVGATPESDYQLITVAENLYQKFDLKRVYYSAFVSVNEDKELPALPGIGVKSAQRIVRARRNGNLTFEDLKKIGVTLKRALYFITCSGRMMYPTKLEEDYITRNLINPKERLPFDRDGMTYRQLSLFDDTLEEKWKLAAGS